MVVGEIKNAFNIAGALLTVLPILSILIICDRIWPDSGWLDIPEPPEGNSYDDY